MELNLVGLEQKLDSLLSQCKKLASENKSLRSEYESLLAQRTEPLGLRAIRKNRREAAPARRSIVAEAHHILL